MAGETQISITDFRHPQGVCKGTIGGVDYVWVVGQISGDSSYWVYKFLASDIGGTPLVSHEEDFTHADFTDQDHLSAPGFDEANGEIYIVAKRSTPKQSHRFVRYNAVTLAYIGYANVGSSGSTYSDYPITGADVQGTFTYSMDSTSDDKVYSFTTAQIQAGLDIAVPVGTVTLTGGTASGVQGVTKRGNFYYVPHSTPSMVEEYDSSGAFVRVYYRSTRDVAEGCTWFGNEFLLATYTDSVGAYIHSGTKKEFTRRYIDLANGSNSADGLSPKTAWLTVAEATSYMSPGVELKFLNGDALHPIRGSTSLNSNCQGVANIPVSLAGPAIFIGSTDRSENVSDHQWTASAGDAGAYYLTDDAGTAVPSGLLEIKSLATCAASAWTTQGTDALTERSVGTAGALTAGEWVWTDQDSLGFSALYYQPASGEDITTLHIEAANTGVTPFFGASRNYLDLNDLHVLLSGDESFKIGTNCRFFRCTQNIGGTTYYGTWLRANCEAHDCLMLSGNRSIYAAETSVRVLNCVVNQVELTNDATNAEVKNTIALVRFRAGTAMVGLDADYNCNESANTNWPTEANGLDTTDPLFTDEAAENYTLQASSPCRGAGVAWWKSAKEPAPQDSNGRVRYSRSVDMGMYHYDMD